MADACCLRQQVAQRVGCLGQDVVIRMGPRRVGIKHREVPRVVQRIGVGHAEASLHTIQQYGLGAIMSYPVAHSCIITSSSE